MVGSTHTHLAPRNVFAGGGEMGARMRAMDWSKTPLGSVDRWPQSLVTMVRTCLSSRIPISIWWGEQLVNLYNDAFIPVLGAKHPRSLGTYGHDAWPKNWPALGPMLDAVLHQGDAIWSEDQLLLVNRRGFVEECYFTFSYSRIRDETGGIGGIYCTVAETTRQVLGERRLKTLGEISARTAAASSAEDACRRAAEALAENSADIPFAQIYLIDGDGTRAIRAATAGSNFGLASGGEELQLGDAVWPLAEVARTHSAVEWDLAHRFAALSPGENTPTRALVLPMGHHTSARPTGFLIVGLSPRLHLDEQYRSFLSLVAGHIATAVEAAQLLRRAKRDVRFREETVAVVGHDLRSPLAAVGTTVELLDRVLSRRWKDGPWPKHVDVIRRSVRRMDQLIGALLDVASIESGTLDIDPQPQSVASLLGDIRATFEPLADDKAISLSVTAAPDIPELPLDKDRILQAIGNLVCSAIKLTPAKGSVTVDAARHKNGVTVSVSDTGVGIAAEDLAHVFDRYWHTPQSDSVSQGLGLAITKGIVAAHGGKVRAKSEVGKGTTFSITLPLMT